MKLPFINATDVLASNDLTDMENQAIPCFICVLCKENFFLKNDSLCHLYFLKVVG